MEAEPQSLTDRWPVLADQLRAALTNDELYPSPIRDGVYVDQAGGRWHRRVVS